MEANEDASDLRISEAELGIDVVDVEAAGMSRPQSAEDGSF